MGGDSVETRNRKRLLNREVKMEGLNERELLEWLENAFKVWLVPPEEEPEGLVLHESAEQAYQQIKERIQAYAEHQELTANYIDIVIDLYDQLEKKKPKLTREWIDEKAEIMKSLGRSAYLTPADRLRAYKKFIRSLVEELVVK